MASFYLILFPTVPTTGFPEIQLDMFLHLSTSMACTSLIPCFKNHCHSPCVNSIHSSKSILSLTFSMEPPFISLALIDRSWSLNWVKHCCHTLPVKHPQLHSKVALRISRGKGISSLFLNLFYQESHHPQQIPNERQFLLTRCSLILTFNRERNWDVER